MGASNSDSLKKKFDMKMKHQKQKDQEILTRKKKYTKRGVCFTVKLSCKKSLQPIVSLMERGTYTTFSSFSLFWSARQEND